MNNRTITVTVGPKGEVTSEVNGVKGPVCSTELDKLLKGLGTTKTEIRKPEYAATHGPVKLTAGAS